MTKRQVTIFAFVPGHEWRMTTADVETDDDIKDAAANFVRFISDDGRCTEVRVYTSQAEWIGSPGRIEWHRTQRLARAVKDVTRGKSSKRKD